MDEKERLLSDGEEIDVSENEEIEETEEIEEIEEIESDNSGQDETVPLNVFLDLKNKYKMTKKEYNELKDKSLNEELKSYKEEVRAKYIKGGYNEDLADMISEDFAKLHASLNKGKSNIEESILDDIEEIKKDPIFSDIDEYKHDIINKIKETKKKGYDLDVEDAYLIVSRQGKTKLREKRLNDTQREVLTKRNKGTVKTNVATSGSSTNKIKYKLDEHDVIALKELQKMQPDAKWTVEKYYKTMKE